MTNVLNTLYVTVPNAYVAREGESLKVKVEKETRPETSAGDLRLIRGPERIETCTFCDTGSK